MVPKISIVTTFYNYGRYLAQSIESVLAQTETNWEYILWDDGSTDGSSDIAMNYLNDPRVIVVKAKHQGRSQALAGAMAKAKGKYIGWLDADDWLAPNCLKLTSQVLDNNSAVGLVYTKYTEVNEQGNVVGIGHKCLVPYLGRDTLLLAFMVFHFRLFHKEIYNRVGGVDLLLNGAIDYDFCLKASEICNFYHLEEPLYYYRIHSASMSNAGRIDQDKCAQIAKENALRRRGYL